MTHTCSLTDPISSSYTTIGDGISWSDLPGTFDANWNGRDTYESASYDPTGQRLLLAGSFTVNAAALVSLGSGNLTVASSAALLADIVGHIVPASRCATSRRKLRRRLAAGLGLWLLGIRGIRGHDRERQPSLLPTVRCPTTSFHAACGNLFNYYDPEQFGPWGDFSINFKLAQNVWFAYTGGFTPKWARNGMPNTDTPDTMTISDSSIGCGAGASRSPSVANQRVIAAVWNTTGGTGAGGWDMGWLDNPTFSKSSNRSYNWYTTEGGTVSVVANGTVALSFDGSDPSVNQDFTVTVPAQPARLQWNSVERGATAVPFSALLVVAGSGSTYFNYDSTAGTTNCNFFVCVKPEHGKLGRRPEVDLLQRLPRGARQYTQASYGTLSYGVDQNSATCGTLGYNSFR